MFIRIKKIGGNDYAYLVENRWISGKNSKGWARQKVKGYLGRVYSFEKANEKEFFGFLSIGDVESYLDGSDINRIISDLVKWEIYRHNACGFDINLNEKEVRKDNRNCGIKINEGVLCKHTLNSLLDFKAEGDEREVGMELAKAFVEAGIDVPKEVFVGLFGKMFRSKDGNI